MSEEEGQCGRDLFANHLQAARMHEAHRARQAPAIAQQEEAGAGLLSWLGSTQQTMKEELTRAVLAFAGLPTGQGPGHRGHTTPNTTVHRIPRVVHPCGRRQAARCVCRLRKP